MQSAESYEGRRALGSLQGSESGALFGQVMGLVAVTLGSLTLGAYVGRDLGEGASLIFFIIGFLCFAGLNLARGSEAPAVMLLLAGGLTLGLGLGGGLLEFAPGAVWQAAAATGLFVAGLGSIGYLIRSDLSSGYRLLFLALLALIVFGLVSLFVSIPAGNVVYSVLGLGIFGGYTVLDFNRMRRAGTDEAVQIAAGVFLDIVNIFLFFLRLFGRRSD